MEDAVNPQGSAGPLLALNEAKPGAPMVATAEEKGRLRRGDKVQGGGIGGVPGYLDAEGNEVRATTIKIVGPRTFYLRKGVWQEADLPERVDPVMVKYYSDEFFKILEENPELNPIATLDADVIVRIGEKYYRLAK